MLRCPKKGCQTTHTLWEGFVFQFIDLNSPVSVNSKLTQCQIMEFLFTFVIEMPDRKTPELTGRAETTVKAWFDTCCTVCTSILTERGKVFGIEEKPIQIDEVRFAG